MGFQRALVVVGRGCESNPDQPQQRYGTVADKYIYVSWKTCVSVHIATPDPFHSQSNRTYSCSTNYVANYGRRLPDRFEAPAELGRQQVLNPVLCTQEMADKVDSRFERDDCHARDGAAADH